MCAPEPPKAPLAGAFVLSCLLAPAADAGPLCPADRIDERPSVEFVIDGDTVALTDGRHVRFAGIDTPEIGRDGTRSQPFAEAARERVASRIGPGARVKLRHESDAHDKYGRLLAHVYTDDGRSVQADLLERGLAVTLVVPPNGWSHACYQEAENAARAVGTGIWALAGYQPVEAGALPASARGFRIVRGRVRRVGESRGNVWLDLAEDVSLRLPKVDLRFFEAYDPRALLGRRVEARGWVQQRRGQRRITVRHPTALIVLE